MRKNILRKDGRRVPIELLVHLARDAEGKPEYYYSFLTDITERKRAEEVVRRLNAELQQRITELQTVNEALRASRRAALNLMEDASRLASRPSRPAPSCAALPSSGAWRWRPPTSAPGIPLPDRPGVFGTNAAGRCGASASRHDRLRRGYCRHSSRGSGGVDEAVKQALAGKNGGGYHRDSAWFGPTAPSIGWLRTDGSILRATATSAAPCALLAPTTHHPAEAAGRKLQRLNRTLRRTARVTRP